MLKSSILAASLLVLIPVQSHAYVAPRTGNHGIQKMRLYQRPSRRAIVRNARRIQQPTQMSLTKFSGIYTGTFKWQPGFAQRVQLRIRGTRSSLTTLRFSGHHTYKCDTTVRVRGSIDTGKGTFHMIEIGQPTETFVTDGSFEGRYSGDIDVIDALWTTRGTGETGLLKLERMTPQSKMDYDAYCQRVLDS